MKRTLPFQIKKQGNEIKGFFKSSKFTAIKTLRFDEKNHLLKVRTEFKSPEPLKSLQILFSDPLPLKEKGNFFSSFLMYGRNVFKGFCFL